MSTRLALLATLLSAACGRGQGLLEEHCAVDRDCEAGLTCQDPNGMSVCYPDDTVGCKGSADCRSDEFCVPYGHGAFCRLLPDLSVIDAASERD